MFCICHHISTSFVSPFKVRDKTLQSWDSQLPKEADFGWPQILDEGRSE